MTNADADEGLVVFVANWLGLYRSIGVEAFSVGGATQPEPASKRMTIRKYTRQRNLSFIKEDKACNHY
ncbi:hypothetical protein [Methanoregula sp. PtaB.Bin085]|uniref:hypothetical protein n=1 Tax=Methanoregula sp. PtaB.Bin085 TaxID=1811680 RepID=UPI0025DE5F15|nr:hypothetical protein [Methanoregula sp. PtaB.Bin085]